MTDELAADANEDNARRALADRLLTTPAYLQTGDAATIERAVELAVSLDHLRREHPALLAKLRTAHLQRTPVEAPETDIPTLAVMDLTGDDGVPAAEARPLVLAMLRGAAGEEAVDNPFVDRPSRALFDYLRHEALVAMIYDPVEVKAVHENDTVIDLMAAKPNDRWIGYVQGRGTTPPPGHGPTPSLN